MYVSLQTISPSRSYIILIILRKSFLQPAFLIYITFTLLAHFNSYFIKFINL